MVLKEKNIQLLCFVSLATDTLLAGEQGGGMCVFFLSHPNWDVI